MQVRLKPVLRAERKEQQSIIGFCELSQTCAAYHINNISEKMKKAAALF
jgi:hypothetical protein